MKEAPQSVAEAPNVRQETASASGGDGTEKLVVKIRESYLAVFRSTAESRRSSAIGALGGVYYSFKSERLVERLMVPLSEHVAAALVALTPPVVTSTDTGAEHCGRIAYRTTAII